MLQESDKKIKNDETSKPKTYSLLRLMPYLRRYPVMVALSLGALLVAALSTLALPFAIRLVIDQGFVGRDGAVIDGYFQLLLGIVTILALASSLRFYCAYWLGERLVADLKHDVFQKLISFSGAFYDQNHSGEIMSRMAADTTLINTAIRANVSQALRNMLVFIGGLVMMVVSLSLALLHGDLRHPNRCLAAGILWAYGPPFIRQGPRCVGRVKSIWL